MAPLGIVNVHASLLPRWRGAAPIQRAILAGDEIAGVSIMRIGHGVDTGAYCAQASTPVAGKHAEALTMELGELGGKLLADTLPSLADCSAVWTEQDESLVTHAAKISKQEMRLDPQMAALDCVRHVLASSDTAPARCVIAGKTVRVLDAALTDVSLGKGGVDVKNKRVFLGLSDGAVELLEVKPDGKRAMAAVLLGLLGCKAPILSGWFVMSKLSPARKLALDVLMEADRRGMYARDVLSSRASAKAIDQRDSAFAARLALGVAATQGILDELLDQFLDKPKKVAPRVRMALRISAFEMLYLHTPGRVAVSQGVELVRSGAKSAAGLANAVLHKVADNVEDFATASDVDESERRLVRLSRLMGLPRWLCARIMASFDTPEGALSFAGNLAPAPLALHKNAFATKPDPYISQLVAPVFPGCHAPVDAQVTVASGVFERAAAVASDLNAQLIATAATRLEAALRLVPVVAPRPM